MKKHLGWLPLLALVAGCQKDDSTPAVAFDEFTVQTVGFSRDCGTPLIKVLDRPRIVAQLVGAPGPVYSACQLAVDLARQPDRLLLVRVRRSVNSEVLFCTAYGPSFPQLTVVSARVR